jgi:hypothetical protein
MGLPCLEAKGVSYNNADAAKHNTSNSIIKDAKDEV